MSSSLPLPLQHSEPIRAAAIDAVLDCVEVLTATQRTGSSIVQRCTAVSDFIQLVSDPVPSPASIIFAPVFPHKDNTSLVGTNSIIFNWDTLLSAADILDDKSLDCVVEATAGVGGRSLSQRTFELNSVEATYVGEGDLHDSSAPDDRISLQLSYGTELATSVTYTLHFQPNTDFYDHYHTLYPVLVMMICAVVTIGISTIFMAYDWLVRHDSVENKMLLDSKRVFVRFVSHEIRTPINTITLGLELLTSRLASLEPSMFRSRRGSNSTGPSPRHSKNESDLRALALQAATNYPSSPASISMVSPSGMSQRSRGRRSSARTTPTEVVLECLELVGELTESSKTAVVVLNELINYDKIEMEKFHVERRVCEIYSVLKDTVRPLEVQAKQRKVKLTLKKIAGMEKSLFVIGDAVKLGQVFRYGVRCCSDMI
jgi:signal transduction histidine kinase